jgi:glycosyltransferase family protein
MMENVLKKNKADKIYPEVLSIDQTIEILIRDKLSLSRFGDGEFNLCFNKKIRFQKPDKELSKRLRDILKDNGRSKCLVAIPEFSSENNTSFWKQYWFENIKRIAPLLVTGYTYGNMGVTRQSTISQLMKFLKLWENKKCVFVIGENSRFEFVPELFGNIKDHSFIYGPPIDAWQKYDELIDKAGEFIAEKDKVIFLISLGPAATVLAYDLSSLGFQALDIGHITNYYKKLLNNEEDPENLPLIKSGIK